MNAMRFQATITSIRSRVDRSVGGSFATQELSDEDKVRLFQLHNSLCEFVIIPEGATAEDIADKPTRRPVKNSTPSQQLRFTIAAAWQRTDKQLSQEDHYRAAMNQILADYRRNYLNP